jgi:hypothetical protein
VNRIGAKGTLVHLREQLHRLVNVTFSCLGNAPAEANLSLSPAFFEGGRKNTRRGLVLFPYPPHVALRALPPKPL